MFKAKLFPKPIFYVYGLICPISQEIKYIGLTKNPSQRLYQHLNNLAENKLKREWINELKKMGLKPNFEILNTYTDRAFASKEEIRYIEENRDTVLNGKKSSSYPEFGGKYSYEGLYEINMSMTKDILNKLEFIVEHSKRNFKTYKNSENQIASLINEKYESIIKKKRK